MIPKSAILAVVVIAVLAGAAYYSTSSPGTVTSSSTVTTSTSCATVTSSSSVSSNSSSYATSSTGSSSTTTIASSSSTNATNGSFTFSPGSPVRIDSVTATTTTQSDGSVFVTFQVLLENDGATPVFVLGGCGSGLSSSISGNSSVLSWVLGGPLCDCAAIVVTLDQGQNHTSTNPGCWSGYNYELMGHGPVTMNMTVQWSSNGQDLLGTNSTSIRAEFTL
jgi:hypothetical protein